MCEVVDPGAGYGWAHDYGYQVWADSKKHGNTLIGKLSDVLHKLDELH